MIGHAASVVAILAALCAFSSLGYYALCLWGTRRFLKESAAENTRPATFTPPVSILKPLKGTDPEMYESFRSHCLQRYPEYEIVFGVNDTADPAVDFVARLKQEFPQRAINLVVCSSSVGANIKVANLAQMVKTARYEHLLVNDSDIRVEPNYLSQVIGPLCDPKTGLVTCLYRGVAAPTLGSRLEALGISTDFCAGVLAAREVERGLHFGLGSTLAFRRQDLQAAGGFEAIVDYLADDYELGRRITTLGLQVELAPVVVETFLPAYSWGQFLKHQLRWARAIRDSRPGGYVGLIATFGLPWALLTVLAAGGAAWAWGLLAAVLTARVALALMLGRSALQDRQVVPLLPWLSLRDLLALWVWIAGFAGNEIVWRGESFTLRKGRLTKQ